MGSIKSKLVPVQIALSADAVDADWKDVVCLKSAEHTSERASVPIETYCGSDAEYADNVAFGFSGTAVYDPSYDDASQVSYMDMQGWQNAGTKVYARMTNGTNGANLYTMGLCLITSLKVSGDVSDVLQWDFTLTGTGVKTTIDPNAD